MQKLNLPPFEPLLREAENLTQIFDIVRRRYVALTPEEWVRQHVIHALHQYNGYPIELMQIEGAISVNGLSKRCDIVIYNREGRPVIIVECKKPEIRLSQKVLDQICRYNLTLNVPYLYITNGLQHVVLQVDATHRCLKQLEQLPLWEEII